MTLDAGAFGQVALTVEGGRPARTSRETTPTCLEYRQMVRFTMLLF